MHNIWDVLIKDKDKTERFIRITSSPVSEEDIIKYFNHLHKGEIIAKAIDSGLYEVQVCYSITAGA